MSLSRIWVRSLIFIAISGWMPVLAQNAVTVTDTSDEFLLGDPGWEDVATAVPTIDFKLVRLSTADDGFSHWCNVVLGPDGRYYFGVGDHDPGGIVLLVAYDPVSKIDEICINSEDIPELKDGKWHGRPDINPENGDMYLLGFYNGNLVYYNIYSKQVEHLGQPVPGEGFPEHTWDWEKDRLYGVGHSGNLLVYDTRNRTIIFHGNPPGGAYWNDRARLLDPDTGCLYGSDEMNYILRYDPSDNSFTTLNSHLDGGSLRAWTNTKEDDGSFWIFDRSGNVFKFYPEQDKIEHQGENLGDGSYVTFIERSPGGRYLYYSPARIALGIPIIQYDTQTNQKKIVAFLQSYYSSKYNYNIHGFYGGALSEDGSSLFVVCNGYWGDKERPGMFHIHIPSSERADEPATDVINHHENIPSKFMLAQNYPNPFNPETMIDFYIVKSCCVSLRIIDVRGRHIRTLVDRFVGAGTNSVLWNGRDGSGKLVSAGLYFYSIQIDGVMIVRKMMLLK